MFRKILLASAIAGLAAVPANAADAFDWNGFYAGVNAGFGGNTFQYPVTGDIESGMSSTTTLDAKAHLTSSGFLGGVQVGYNYAYPSDWLIGVEADIDASGIEGELAANGALAGDITGSATLSAGSKIDYLGTVRARAGYIYSNNFLVYATAGLAYGGVKSRYDIGLSDGSSSILALAGSKSSSQTGWTIGAGAEYPITDKVTFKAEYLYADLGTKTLIDTPFSLFGDPGNIRVEEKATAHIVRVGLNYALD